MISVQHRGPRAQEVAHAVTKGEAGNGTQSVYYPELAPESACRAFLSGLLMPYSCVHSPAPSNTCCGSRIETQGLIVAQAAHPAENASPLLIA